MKKIIPCVLAVLSISGGCLDARAGILYKIHVSWGYTSPLEPVLTGFVLYQEGVKVADFVGAELRESDALCFLTKEITNFTLTAAFDDGTESPHSIPRPYNWINARPATVKEFMLISQKGIKLKPGTTLMMASIDFSKKG